MTHFFKYKYHISIIFIITLFANTVNSFQLFKVEDFVGFAIFNVVFISTLAISIKNKRDLKNVLSRYNSYEKISKWTLFILLICVSSTIFSIVINLKIFNFSDSIIKNKGNIASLPVFAFMIFGLSHINKYFHVLFFCMNPNNIITMLNDNESVNKKIEKELRKTQKLFSDKNIYFEYNVKPYKVADIMFFVDKGDFILLKIGSIKNKIIYKIDNTFFHYGKKSFKKVELYHYLKSTNLKLDTMSDEDWKVVEMYLIS